MKFICNKEELTKAINIVIRAAYGKYQKSILECIHIVAKDGLLSLDAFDGTTAMKTEVYADVAEAGQTAIPARIFYDIVSKFPSGELAFERDGNTILVKGENSKASLQEMDAEQFPVFPELEGEELSINRKVLGSMIDKTAFSAYVGEDKPIFTGLLFETDPEAGKLNVVGIDGIRLARQSAKVSCKQKIRSVIPAKTLKDVARIIGDEDSEIKLYFGQSSCFILCDNTVIYTRPIDGEFMNYESIIPKGIQDKSAGGGQADCQKPRFGSCSGQGGWQQPDSHGGRQPEHEVWRGLGIRRGAGRAAHLYGGRGFKIAFNAKYLLDVFRVVEEKEVFMEFDSRLKPCVIRPYRGRQLPILGRACQRRILGKRRQIFAFFLYESMRIKKSPSKIFGVFPGWNSRAYPSG